MINELTLFKTAIKTATETLPTGQRAANELNSVALSGKNTVAGVTTTQLQDIYDAATFAPLAPATTTALTLIKNVSPTLGSSSFALPVSLATTVTTAPSFIANKIAGSLTSLSTQNTTGGDFALNYVNPAAAIVSPSVTLKSGTTHNAFVLESKIGAATLTVTENISGKTPFAGNGVVKETVVFTGTDKDTLTISSATSSVNVADNGFNGNNANTEFASSVDALNQNRNVVYTNTNQKVTSVYKFGTKHSFNEDANGNQAFSDGTDKVYNYNDPNLKIVSHSQTGFNANTNFISGAENLVKKVNASYSYAATDKSAALDYVVAQTKTSTTTSATTSETTTTQLPKFALAKDGFTLTASGTIVHKQVFNDNSNSAAVNSAHASTISTPPTRTQTSDTYDVRTLSVKGGNADYKFEVKKFLDVARTTSTDHDVAAGAVANNGVVTVTGSTDGKVLNVFGSLGLDVDAFYGQDFTASVNGAAADKPAALELKYVLASGTVQGTNDSDNITVTKVDGLAVYGLFGDDTITGAAGNDTLDGQQGNDVIAGGLGNDLLIGGRGTDKVDGGDGSDTFQPAFTAITNITAIDFEGTGTGAAAGTITGFNVDLSAQTSTTIGLTSNVVDTLVSIENVTGSNLNDVIVGSDSVVGGSDGANVITGGNGADTLTGGTGADIFAYTSKILGATATTANSFRLESGGAGFDTITDFISGTDKIQLSVDLGTAGAVGTTLVLTGKTSYVSGAPLIADDLVSKAGLVAAAATTNSSGRFVFSADAATKTTTLFYDGKGDSAAATLGLPAQTDDFVVLKLIGATAAPTLLPGDFIFA